MDSGMGRKVEELQEALDDQVRKTQETEQRWTELLMEKEDLEVQVAEQRIQIEEFKQQLANLPVSPNGTPEDQIEQAQALIAKLSGSESEGVRSDHGKKKIPKTVAEYFKLMTNKS